MILDGLYQFTGTAGTVSVDTPTTGTQQSTNVLNLLNARDMGIGDDPAIKLLVEIVAAFTGGTSLEVQLQGAPDSAGSPGSYTTMATSGVIAEANLIAGRYILAIDMPRPAPGQANPQYLRLQYVTVGTHSTGTIFGALVLDRQDQFTYPAGITIAN